MIRLNTTIASSSGRVISHCQVPLARIYMLTGIASVPIVPRLRFVPDVPIVYRIQDRQGRLPRFRNCENVEIRATSVSRMLQPFLTNTATRSRHSNGSISFGSAQDRRYVQAVLGLKTWQGNLRVLIILKKMRGGQGAKSFLSRRRLVRRLSDRHIDDTQFTT
jgi:hypothetical protein